MPQDLRDTIGWLVVNALPDDTPVRAAREIAETLTERVGAILMGQDPDLQPPPPPAADPEPESEDRETAWPTVAILRKALIAVDAGADLSPAMEVLVDQALHASAWAAERPSEP